MAAASKISIILMHDNGHTRRIRMASGLYRFLWVSMLVLPLLAAGALCLCSVLWQKNRQLSANTERLELMAREAQVTAEKLSNLRALLEHPDSADKGAVLQNLARQSAKEPPTALFDPALSATSPAPQAGNEDSEAPPAPDPLDKGPGHAEFPVVDTKAVSVENSNVRLLSKGKIRINLDLRNGEAKKSIAGEVRCSFIAGNGEIHPLPMNPDQSDFKINRFKRVVFQPTVPPGVDTVNARVIIEVLLDGGQLVYRNIFPVEL